MPVILFSENDNELISKPEELADGNLHFGFFPVSSSVVFSRQQNNLPSLSTTIPYIRILLSMQTIIGHGRVVAKATQTVTTVLF